VNSFYRPELNYWLATSHLLSVKPTKLSAWLEKQGDFQSLFATSAQDLTKIGFTENEIEKIKAIDWTLIEKERQWYERQGAVLTLQDPRYPPLLKELVDPPLVLYVSGDFEILKAAQLGMVGSRKLSPTGAKLAERFAKALVEKGLVITSGLARGIDAVCHQGALQAGGQTIAVLGTGLNQIYPRQHEGLAKAIREQGALVSEFPLNTPPSPWNFPRRNRIISGLSLGVLVVEAALYSGSLITARFAMEQNREVFAIPGSINHPLARGCHELLREGAKLVESVGDIIEELGPFKPVVGKVRAPDSFLNTADLDSKFMNLLNYIEYSVTAFDTILLGSGLTAAEVSSMLLVLELKGYVEAVQGGYMRCV
jgi:DNA processing protein